jgi:hypothetical protein
MTILLLAHPIVTLFRRDGMDFLRSEFRIWFHAILAENHLPQEAFAWE